MTTKSKTKAALPADTDEAPALLPADDPELIDPELADAAYAADKAEGDANEFEFEFSTAAVPPIPFKIDGRVFEMRTLSHITPYDEAEIRVMFRQDTYLEQAVGRAVATKQHGQAHKLAREQTELRLRIITFMTNAPKEVVATLWVPDELRLIRAIFRGFTGAVLDASEADIIDDDDAERVIETDDDFARRRATRPGLVTPPDTTGEL